MFRMLLPVLLAVVMSVNPTGCWFFARSITCDEVDATFTKDDPFDTLPLPSCFDTNFKIYTRYGLGDGYISKTNIPSSFATSKKTVFIVHGFRDSYDDPWKKLIDALLQQGDFNVITVDWSEGSQKSITLGYDNAVSNARVAGKAVHDLFKALQYRGLSPSLSHCIGHSLGAHVCGYAGKYQKFARISGMDPAGPELEKLKPQGRLSSDDAEFVDVIHTNGGGSYWSDYGTLIPMGTLDFYANGGRKQPGCVMKRKRGAVLSNLISCSHGRALALYTESVNSEKCVATTSFVSATEEELRPCWYNCPSVAPVVGYHSDQFSDYSGMFGFITGDVSPYCG